MPTLQNLRSNVTPGFAPSSAPKYPWRALYVGGTVFGLTLLLYAGMELGYRPYLETSLKRVQQKQVQASAEISSVQEEDLVLFYSQLTNLQKLLSEHVRPSSLLRTLEEITLPRARYTQMTLSVPERNLLLMGVAADFFTVAQQAQQYTQAPEIERVFLKRTQREKGFVTFDLDVAVDQSVLRYSSVQ